ncbi:hypothetical protein N7455_004225, partial [Penicillium solitum]|uniref:uncharacterized protein n=1 Tax=Penicillium solitum TaxID=60172 RepID=UPI0032C415B1
SIGIHVYTEHITLGLLFATPTTNAIHYITALFLTASLLGMVAATRNPVHRYAQLCACGQPGCRASNLGRKVSTAITLVYVCHWCHSEPIEVPLIKCVSGEHEYKMYKLVCDD